MANKRLSVTIDADTSSFQKSMNNMKSSMKEATGGISNSLGDMQKSLGNVSDKMSTAGTNMTKWVTGPIVALTAGIFGLMTKTGDYADRILDLSDITGMSTDAIQEWAYVADIAGVNGEAVTNAVTGLVRRLPQLESEGGKATEAVNKLGLSYDDLSKLSPDEQVEALMYALSDIEDPLERNAIGSQLFGGAWQDIAPILSMGADEMANVRDEAHDMNAVMGEEGLKEANAFRQEMERIKNELTGVAREVAGEFLPIFRDNLLPLIKDNLIPAFKDFAEWIKSVIEWFSGLSPEVQGAIGKFIAFAAALGPILVVGAKIVAGIKILIGVIAFLLTPVGAVIAIIAGLIAIGVLLYKNWDEIKAKASQVWGSIREFFTGVHESIQQTFQNAWEGIKNFFIGLHESIQTAVQAVWRAVADFFRGIWESIVSTARAIWEPIKKFFSTLWEGVKKVFEVIWNAIKTVLMVIMGLIMVAIATAWNAIADTINGVLNVIKAIVTTVWNAIKGTVQTVVNAIRTVITTVWNAIKTVVTTVLNSIRSVITTVWNSIRDVVTTVVNAIRNVITTVFNAIRTVTTSVWNSIKNVITTVVNAIRNVVTTIWNAIQTVTTTVFNSIRNIATTVWNAIRTAITTVINAIRTVVTTVWNAILTVITTILNSIRTTVTTIWNGIRTTISTIVNGVRTTVTNTFNGLKGTVTRIWNSIKSAIETPIKKARNTVRTMIDQIKGFFNFQWKLPKLKMPRFSVSGSANPLNWLSQGVPKINVDWFATGGIATGASVVGIGEKGSEAIVPLSQKHRMKPFAEAVASMMPQDNNDGGSKGETIITGNTFVVREEADIKKIAQELKKLDDRESRGRGKRGGGN